MTFGRGRYRDCGTALDKAWDFSRDRQEPVHRIRIVQGQNGQHGQGPKFRCAHGHAEPEPEPEPEPELELELEQWLEPVEGPIPFNTLTTR